MIARDCILKLLLTAVCLVMSLSAEAKAEELVMIESTNSGGGVVQIDGGAKQDTKNWPATLKYLVAGKFTCTSTIVGERTVITVAHCLPDGSTTRVEIGDKKFNLTCTCILTLTGTRWSSTSCSASVRTPFPTQLAMRTSTSGLALSAVAIEVDKHCVCEPVAALQCKLFERLQRAYGRRCLHRHSARASNSAAACSAAGAARLALSTSPQSAAPQEKVKGSRIRQ
ncbi:trypsin-like serine protease [Bradyrhizobium pachyrhizi]|uniref:trypsin-like serine protease n=1 Tax=Bradyrhizobium pachyrhizi TaxID=280333 RepID=UPI0018F8C05B|nr:trypsin-like serine protease [Bradyrhizobium pachyrhizi]